MSPKVSVILPTKNRISTLPFAIQSVLAQSFRDLELIAIDDGSTDGTFEKLEEVAATDPRIRVIRNASSIGFPAALNRGLNEAKGEWIARIDDDDMWIDPEKLEKQIAFLNVHPGCVLLGTSFEATRPDGSIAYRIVPSARDEDIRKNLLVNNPFGHSTVVFSKSSAEDAGGYDESLSYTEDYDLWCRLGRLGGFANLPDVFVRYAVGNGMSYANRRRQAWYRMRILWKYGAEYPGVGKAFVRILFSLIRSHLRS